jgi:hypothetical protein
MTPNFEPTFLVERPETQRIWVVRASGGHYVRHFRQAGVMAIGHLNEISVAKGPMFGVHALDIERALKAVHRDRKKASITSHAKQVEAFCIAINKDDLVVTLDSRGLMVGRVASTPAYIDTDPIVLKNSDGTEDKMHHQLRRKVSWGPYISREAVPIAMEMTLRAHQTVFNIDGYWASVYHLLYPCFTFQGRLYLSANIRQQDAIDNYSVSQLFGLLSGVEVMAKLLSAGSDAWSQYPHNLVELRETLDLNLSSKAEFMSPGTVWSTLELDSTGILWAAVIYVMLFGGDLKFFKADGIIDTHTRQKIWDLVLKLRKTHDVEKIQKKLKVEVPKLETENIEVPAQKAKRTRRTAAVVEKKDLDKNF